MSHVNTAIHLTFFIVLWIKIPCSLQKKQGSWLNWVQCLRLHTTAYLAETTIARKNGVGSSLVCATQTHIVLLFHCRRVPSQFRTCLNTVLDDSKISSLFCCCSLYRCRFNSCCHCPLYIHLSLIYLFRIQAGVPLMDYKRSLELPLNGPAIMHIGVGHDTRVDRASCGYAGPWRRHNVAIIEKVRIGRCRHGDWFNL